MNRGLYVDAWRGGLRNQQEVDEMLTFCRGANITDIYVHMQRDLGSLIDYDYLNYIISQKGTMRIHAWFSLQVGRANAWTRAAYNNNWIMQVGNILMLDPTVVQARNYWTQRIGNFFQKSPGLYGIHLDKLRYTTAMGRGTDAQKTTALNTVVSMIRAVNSSIYVTATIPWPIQAGTICPWQTWVSSAYVNEVYPLMFFNNEVDFVSSLNTLPAEATTVVFPCGNFNVSVLNSRLALLKAKNLNVVFYSYRYRPFNSSMEDYRSMIYGYN